MSLIVNWTVVEHLDLILLFIFLLVWLVQWIIGIVGRAPRQP